MTQRIAKPTGLMIFRRACLEAFRARFIPAQEASKAVSGSARSFVAAFQHFPLRSEKALADPPRRYRKGVDDDAHSRQGIPVPAKEEIDTYGRPVTRP